MPILRVKNSSLNSVNLGSSLGTLPAGKTISKDLSVSEIENLSQSLSVLQSKSLIIWTIEYHTEEEGRAEFAPIGATATKTQARLEMWVDASSGSDLNDGLTPQTALQSIVEAEQRIPDVVLHDVLVHVAPHTGNGYVPPAFRARIMRANIDIIADSGGTNGDGFNVLYTGTAQTGTLHTKCIAPAGLGVDTYRGKTIEMLSGVQAGYRRTIATNTDTDIVPCLLWRNDPFVTSIGPGDEFRLIEPITTIFVPPGTVYAPHPNGSAAWEMSKGPTPQYLYFSNGGSQDQPSINFVNFKLLTSDATIHMYIGAPVRCFGCETSGALSIGAGAFGVGTDGDRGDNYSEIAQVGYRCTGVAREAWAGWGLTCGTGFLVTRTTSCAMFGLVAARAMFFQCPSAQLQGCNIHTLGVQIYGDANSPGCVVLSGKHYLPDINQRITNTTGHAVTVQGFGAIAELDESTLTAPLGAGIYATQGGQVRIVQSTSIVAQTGLKAEFGGRIHFRAGAASITATGNQLEAGTTPTASTLAALATVGAYVSEADGSVIQRVP